MPRTQFPLAHRCHGESPYLPISGTEQSRAFGYGKKNAGPPETIAPARGIAPSGSKRPGYGQFLAGGSLLWRMGRGCVLMPNLDIVGVPTVCYGETKA